MNRNLQNQRNQPRAVIQSSLQTFSGPLPPPEALLKYNEAVPGAAERIIKMAEDQSAHRRELEKNAVASDISRSKWGQILGFIIALSGLTASVLISIYGNAIAGGIIGTTTIASLVGVFMYGSRTRSIERAEKRSEE